MTETKKIVINRCFGGFGMSDEAIQLYENISGRVYNGYDIKRDDPSLIEVVETLGSDRASASLGHLKIVEIPADVDWVLEEYDGWEWVAEVHRTWC